MIRRYATDEEIAEGKRQWDAQMAALEKEKAEIEARLAEIQRAITLIRQAKALGFGVEYAKEATAELDGSEAQSTAMEPK